MFTNNRMVYTILKGILFCLIAFSLSESLKAQRMVSENWSKPNLLGFDTGWKFEPGIARPEYFKRDFNDGHWQSVTYKFLDTLAPGTKDFQGVGTIRRKFYVADSMKGKPVEL